MVTDDTDLSFSPKANNPPTHTHKKKKERGKGKIANLQESSCNRSSFLDSG